MTEFDRIASILPPRIRRALENADGEIKKTASEIRIMKDSPLAVTILGKRIFIDENGNRADFKTALTVSEKETEETSMRISDYSYYAHEKDIERGFVTLKGGHRVGLAGKGEEKNGEIVLREITSFNFRIAKTVKGAASEILHIVSEPRFSDTLILSPPCGGKTTVLRDLSESLARLGKTVSVIDCLGELSLGKGYISGCDVLEGFSKSDGIKKALRFLSPDVILCDEITTEKEVREIESGMNSGVKFVVTSHAENIEDAQKRSVTRTLSELFEISVFLEGRACPGKIKEVIRRD